MGCSTCKQKNEKEKVNDDETLEINFVPKSIQENG